MRRLREAAALLGPGPLRLLAASMASGLLKSCSEVVFAAILQSFLVQVGALRMTATILPAPFSRLHQIEGGMVFAAMIGIGALRALLVALDIYLKGATGQEVQYVLRTLLSERLFRARTANGPELMTLFSSRAETLDMAAGAVQILVSHIAASLLLLIALVLLSPGLTALVVAVALLSAIPLREIDRFANRNGQALKANLRAVTAHILSSVRNLVFLQILGIQAGEGRFVRRELEDYRRRMRTHYLVTGLKTALPQAIGVVIVCLIAAIINITGALAPGALISYFYLLLRLVQLSSIASQASTTIAYAAPQVEEILDWSRRPEDAILPAANAGPPASAVGYRLRSASFRYARAAQDSVSGVDLDLAPGEALVVTGASGAGKSTLLLLLLGLLEPTAGTVEALMDDGAQSAASARGRLLPGVGFVGPDSFIIEGSVLDNLRYGLVHEPSNLEIDEALAFAECDFVNALPDGLAHRLTEQGQGLSAGQKQRLMLARALLRRPAVLVLDEATAHLDAETEMKIIQALKRRKGRMTLLVVAHRASLLSLADRTLALPERPRIESGSTAAA